MEAVEIQEGVVAEHDRGHLVCEAFRGGYIPGSFTRSHADLSPGFYAGWCQGIRTGLVWLESFPWDRLVAIVQNVVDNVPFLQHTEEITISSSTA